MSGPYWDFRTCCWQGGTPPQAPPPIYVAVRQSDRPAGSVSSQPVPAQATAADAEPVEALVRST